MPRFLLPLKRFPGPLVLRVTDGQFSSRVENVGVEFNPMALVPAFVAWCSEIVNNLRFKGMLIGPGASLATPFSYTYESNNSRRIHGQSAASGLPLVKASHGLDSPSKSRVSVLSCGIRRASSIIAFLARDSSVSPLASGDSSIPMVWYSNGHDPHTGVDVGDALPWWLSRALSARSIHGPPLIALAAKARQAGQGAVPTKHLWQGQMRTRRRILLPLTNQEKRATDLRMRPWREKKRRGGWSLGGQVGWIRRLIDGLRVPCGFVACCKGVGTSIGPCTGTIVKANDRLEAGYEDREQYLLCVRANASGGGETTPENFDGLAWLDASFQNGGEPLVPLPFAKGAILSPSQDGRDRSSVSSSSVRISPAPPTRSLRPNHFYFILTASLVTRRRTLVLYTHSGTEERETDGRTRKSHLKNSTRAASTSGDSTRFSRVLALAGLQGPAGPGHNASTAFSPLKLLTPLSAPIHFCQNKTPVNLGDDSSFVIRGGIGELYFPEPAAYTLGMITRSEPADFRAVGTPAAHTLVHLPNEDLVPDMQKTETTSCQNGGSNVYEARGSTNLAITKSPLLHLPLRRCSSLLPSALFYGMEVHLLRSL
ncbi:hypothetical protein EDB84DRAFT_1434583 [Lactarius hengduanensis]|nr:hypothetical protein EDB84DRAFT_1434583 [Lactarius hengduanensis]